MFKMDTDGDYIPINADMNDAFCASLPAGVYEVGISMGVGFYFQPYKTVTEPLVYMDTPTSRKVIREVNEFFDPEKTARLAQYGLKHRRGIILYGPPGTGKTSLVRSLFPYLMQQRAVVLVDPCVDDLEGTLIPAIRRNDPDRPIVLFFDEFEQTATYYKSNLLELLDGLSSPDHLLTIGCTNYLERISPQMSRRPSRFGLVLEVKELDMRVRKLLVETKYAMLSQEMQEFVVEITATLPVDYLEEASKLALLDYEMDEIRTRIHDIPQEAFTIHSDDE